MKKVIHPNPSPAYSLHDMNVIAFTLQDDVLLMHTQSGMVRTTTPYAQVDGYVEFHQVDWDCSYVYRLNFTGNVGQFSGEKLFLRDFIAEYQNAGFSIIDESYGYNQAKYSGYLSMNQTVQECMIEIYHTGDVVFVETDET